MATGDIKFLERPSVALANLLQGELAGAGTAIWDPDVLPPEQRVTTARLVADKLFGPDSFDEMGGIKKALLEIATNPLTILGAYMALRYPVPKMMNLLKFQKKWTDVDRAFGTFGTWTRSQDEIFQGSKFGDYFLKTLKDRQDFMREFGGRFGSLVQEARNKGVDLTKGFNQTILMGHGHQLDRSQSDWMKSIRNQVRNWAKKHMPAPDSPAYKDWQETVKWVESGQPWFKPVKLDQAGAEFASKYQTFQKDVWRWVYTNATPDARVRILEEMTGLTGRRAQALKDWIKERKNVNRLLAWFDGGRKGPMPGPRITKTIPQIRQAFEERRQKYLAGWNARTKTYDQALAARRQKVLQQYNAGLRSNLPKVLKPPDILTASDAMVELDNYWPMVAIRTDRDLFMMADSILGGNMVPKVATSKLVYAPGRQVSKHFVRREYRMIPGLLDSLQVP